MTNEERPSRATVAKPPRKTARYVPAIGPRLGRLLAVVFGLFALLCVNSVYLAGVTYVEWLRGAVYQNYFYQYMFLVHLILGLVIVVPVVLFGVIHITNSRNRKNRRAIRAGYAMLGTSLFLLATGVALMRLDIGMISLELKNPLLRSGAYWVHVLSPLVAIWLFILHRLAGKRIKWRVGGAWAALAAVFALFMVGLHAQDPRQWNVEGPKSGEQYFFPSLARTLTGNFIPEHVLSNDEYCRKCHEDVHETWSYSAHRFASFNNPVYLASVREARQVVHARDGNVTASRFCAGCHDPVPFFSGAFDDPKFDDPAYDLASDKAAQAGVTCTVCHAITHINSPRGNGDFTIEEPTQYPFTFSRSTFLRWVNRQLVKAKPAFHKKTFLKPLHKEPEFCGACHKVHLPKELNAYKWLRAQNHYDTYHLSGVSGHGVSSFYYPKKAENNCNGCHMPLLASQDFGAQDFDDTGVLKVHDHQFPSANTAIGQLMDHPQWAIEKHQAFNEGVMRVDIFGIRDGGTIDAPLLAPLRPSVVTDTSGAIANSPGGAPSGEVPELVPGREYLFDIVVRTLKMGHPFTQGTADSNEVWLDVTVSSDGRVIGRSGGMRERDGEVDPWSHKINAYVIDRAGRRIDRRNAADIFISLYNHEIPPGAADVIHYKFRVPANASKPISVEVTLRFRKFDATLMKFVEGEAFASNELPIMTLASDSLVFPLVGSATEVENTPTSIDAWERFNDYGIGLLRKGNTGSDKGELRQAEAAFMQVERLGHADGPANLARVYFKEGRLDDAVAALERAAAFEPPAPAWTIAWFTGLVNKQNGHLDDAIVSLRGLVEMDTAETRKREFDFSQDYRLLNELGQTIFARAKQERGAQRKGQRDRLLRDSIQWFERTLKIDPENLAAHYNLALLHGQLGNSDVASTHRALHAKYRPDDNARDSAVAAARIRDPAANHAAEAIVIYDLQRVGAFELPDTAAMINVNDRQTQ